LNKEDVNGYSLVKVAIFMLQQEKMNPNTSDVFKCCPECVARMEWPEILINSSKENQYNLSTKSLEINLVIYFNIFFILFITYIIMYDFRFFSKIRFYSMRCNLILLNYVGILILFWILIFALFISRKIPIKLALNIVTCIAIYNLALIEMFMLLCLWLCQVGYLNIFLSFIEIFWIGLEVLNPDNILYEKFNLCFLPTTVFSQMFTCFEKEFPIYYFYILAIQVFVYYLLLMIRLINVEGVNNKKIILNGLEIKDRKIIMVGPNGCGKTTLLNKFYFNSFTLFKRIFNKYNLFNNLFSKLKDERNYIEYNQVYIFSNADFSNFELNMTGKEYYKFFLTQIKEPNFLIIKNIFLTLNNNFCEINFDEKIKFYSDGEKHLIKFIGLLISSLNGFLLLDEIFSTLDKNNMEVILELLTNTKIPHLLILHPTRKIEIPEDYNFIYFENKQFKYCSYKDAVENGKKNFEKIKFNWKLLNNFSFDRWFLFFFCAHSTFIEINSMRKYFYKLLKVCKIDSIFFVKDLLFLFKIIFVITLFLFLQKISYINVDNKIDLNVVGNKHCDCYINNKIVEKKCVRPCGQFIFNNETNLTDLETSFRNTFIHVKSLLEQNNFSPFGNFENLNNIKIIEHAVVQLTDVSKQKFYKFILSILLFKIVFDYLKSSFRYIFLYKSKFQCGIILVKNIIAICCLLINPIIFISIPMFLLLQNPIIWLISFMWFLIFKNTITIPLLSVYENELNISDFANLIIFFMFVIYYCFKYKNIFTTKIPLTYNSNGIASQFNNRIRNELNDPFTPIQSIIFYGRNGIGKTYKIKQLQKYKKIFKSMLTYKDIPDGFRLDHIELDLNLKTFVKKLPSEYLTIPFSLQSSGQQKVILLILNSRFSNKIKIGDEILKNLDPINFLLAVELIETQIFFFVVHDEIIFFLNTPLKFQEVSEEVFDVTFCSKFKKWL
jgi:ABC-type cobalamin/Fe3+-siderophores transport system ATPase subunit